MFCLFTLCLVLHVTYINLFTHVMNHYSHALVYFSRVMAQINFILFALNDNETPLNVCVPRHGHVISLTLPNRDEYPIIVLSLIILPNISYAY